MNGSRREFLQTGAVSPLAVAAAAAQAAAARPNLVLFMPETVRSESLSCYGHPVAKTPNVDRLAKEGVRFEQCHAQNPVCSPSRCSLLTGWPVHVRGHRSLFYLLRPDEPQMFRYLKQQGYDVFWYGKNDLLAPGSFKDSVTEYASPRGTKPEPGNPWPQTDPHFYSFLYGPSGDRRDTDDYAKVQAGIRAIERAERPFCLFLPLRFAHPPFCAPADFHDMYDPAKLPPLRPPDLAGKPNFHRLIRETRRITALDDAALRKIQAVYLGMISYSDWLLGEMLEALERLGRARDTAVFYFSDHGEWGGDYGLVEKWPSALDDTMTRVPLIVRAPGVKQGHVSREIVELYDVMPTCLSMAGIKPGHTHFARSLEPQLRGEPGDPRRAAFSEGGYNVYEPQCFEPGPADADPKGIYYPKAKLQNDRPETITRASMVRTTEAKLIYRPDGESELYDLARDPRELHNLFGQRGSASVQAGLERRLLDWYARTADTAPVDKDPRGFPPKA
ncbi:MAG: sulfatase-like hydrolase/transferase [Candidatus Solibacter sp.]|nr:sulfatase-like hydrolase/transferase [Candidatus Solibacter sp.]